MRSFSPTLVWRLARKELREILRDRRTIVTLVLMPVLLYPLLGVGFNQYASALRDPGGAAAEYVLAMETREEQNRLTELIRPTAEDPTLKVLETADAAES